MLAKQSSRYITIHHNTSQYYVKRGCARKKADMVWRCLTMFDGVRMCPNVSWQMSNMICSAKHFDPLQAAPLMKQNFLLPRCQWHLHQQHWGRHLPRNSAFTVPRWKCDMWPKTCSTGVLMSSDELWSHCSINMNEQECKKKPSMNVWSMSLCRIVLAAGKPYVRFSNLGWGGAGWGNNVHVHLHATVWWCYAMRSSVALGWVGEITFM